MAVTGVWENGLSLVLVLARSWIEAVGEIPGDIRSLIPSSCAASTAGSTPCCDATNESTSRTCKVKVTDGEVKVKVKVTA